jgi:peptidoglycan/xylan/chitin deacetylase (PgdA/CDA1 family)
MHNIYSVFADQDLSLHFPPNTLSLTYDDGPGPNTAAIADYLADNGIQATFFAVGDSIRENESIVAHVAARGHQIGNHTNHHPQLVEHMRDKPADVIAEVSEVHKLIQRFVGSGPYLFRPPYGQWSKEIAAPLNKDPILNNYIGPIGWDIERGDYEIGDESTHDPEHDVYTVESCCTKFVERTREKGKGVVLLHDWCADPEPTRSKLRNRNQTLKLTQLLVPELKKHFKFIPLTEILKREILIGRQSLMDDGSMKSDKRSEDFSTKGF